MKIANFITDVNNPENKKAEEIGLTTVKNHFEGADVSFEDTRYLNTHWDFILTVNSGPLARRYTFDVKRDTMIEETGRFAFEMYAISKDGGFSPSWGINPLLDFLVVVPASFRFAKILPLQYIRQYISVAQKMYSLETLLSQKRWREIEISNKKHEAGWTTYGFVVPLESAEKFCEVLGAKIIHLETPESVHKKPMRLLWNGREVA